MSGSGGDVLGRYEIAPGYSVCRLIHGGWQLSTGHREEGRDRDRLLREMEVAIEAGADTFDGADIYTGVEELYGELRRRCRKPLQVHTKFVPDLDVLGRISRTEVERVIDRSLSRLAVEALDLVQFHWWEFDVPGHVETMGWLDELRVAGKIRHLGVTNYDRLRLAELLDAGFPVVSNQVQYSLLDRRPEAGSRPSLADLCAQRGVTLLCYGSIAGGFLSHRWLAAADPVRDPEAPSAGELTNRSLVKYRLIVDELGGKQRGWEALQGLLAELDRVAARHGVDPAVVAMRWVLDRAGVGAVVVGWSGLERFERNRDVLGLSLDPDDRSRLERACRDFEGPAGPVYALERDRGGRHGRIMRYDLNQAE